MSGRFAVDITWDGARTFGCGPFPVSAQDAEPCSTVGVVIGCTVAGVFSLNAKTRLR